MIDRRPVPPVQLPSNVFQNYGEEAVEEDDPYRYYQPNYPAPQPVAPEDPVLLESRQRRSPEERSKNPKQRLKAKAGLY